MRSHVTEIEKNSYSFTLVHPCDQTVPEPREVGFGGQLRMDSRSLSFSLVLFPIRCVKKEWIYLGCIRRWSKKKKNYIKIQPASSIHEFSSSHPIRWSQPLSLRVSIHFGTSWGSGSTILPLSSTMSASVNKRPEEVRWQPMVGGKQVFIGWCSNGPFRINNLQNRISIFGCRILNFSQFFPCFSYSCSSQNHCL